MWLAMCCILLCITPHNLQRLVSETSDETDMGTLAGDVQNGALLIQNYILQVSSLLLLFYFIIFNAIS